MNRPAPVSPDNFFLLLFRALRQRRLPLVLRVASHSLLLVTLALLAYSWVAGMQIKHTMQQQADALGQSLLSQTTASATDLLVTNDLLSLNVLLSNLVKNPLVAHAAIYSMDNRILAESGSRPRQNLLGEESGLYSAPITFQEVIAGHLRINLDMQQFQQPMLISLRNMGLFGLGLLILTLSLGLRLGRRLSTPLLQLRVWLRAPEAPAPGSTRQDEIGDLARQLQNLLVTESPAQQAPAQPEHPEEMPLDETLDTLPTLEADPDTDVTPPLETGLGEASDTGVATLPEPSRPLPDAQESAVLAVHLGPQTLLRQLPREQLLALRQQHRDTLEQVAGLYGGELHPLNEGSSLLLFHRRELGDDYLADALCCAELLRAQHHALQAGLDGSGIALQLQLAESRGENLAGLSQAKLLLSPGVQEALTLSQHSRDQLLLAPRIGNDPQIRQRARLQPIDTAVGTADSLEQLLPTYAARQEHQLESLHEAPHHST